VVDGAVRTVTGRRSKWVVLLLGIVTVGLVAPLAGRLVPLEDNSPTSFLPAGAGSTQVVAFQERYDAAATTPAVVVYERPDGLTDHDLDLIAAARAALGADHLPDAAAPSPLQVA